MPVVQSTSVGGLQIIKVDKETGNLHFGDNDTKNFQASGSLNIDAYNTDESSTKDKNSSIEETNNHTDMLPETGGENDFNNILFGVLSLILGISFLGIKN